MPLINCQIELDFLWLRNCIISEISRTPGITADPNANLPVPAAEATLTIGATFQINNAKFYAPVDYSFCL